MAATVWTVIASFATALLGFWLGQRKFRSDQSFQRRVDWHESAVRRLVRASYKLREAANIADDPVLADEHGAAWDAADDALEGIRGLDMEAELYASDAAYNAVVDATRHCDNLIHVGLDVIRIAPGRPAPSETETRAALGILRVGAKTMLHAASRLATDVRKSLVLDVASRPFRLYDDEVTALLPVGSVVAFEQRREVLSELLATGRRRGKLVITRDDQSTDDAV